MKYYGLAFIFMAFSCQSQELGDKMMSVDVNTEGSITEVNVSGSDGSYSCCHCIKS